MKQELEIVTPVCQHGYTTMSLSRLPILQRIQSVFVLASLIRAQRMCMVELSLKVRTFVDRKCSDLKHKLTNLDNLTLLSNLANLTHSINISHSARLANFANLCNFSNLSNLANLAHLLNLANLLH
jgi:hypothetical protein